MDKKDEEVLKDLPKEWIDLLNKMPELKADWIEFKEHEDVESIPNFFFTLYEDYVEKYEDYKPFFTCIERGKEVFDNFYQLYGSWYDVPDEERQEKIKNAPPIQELDDTQLKEIVTRYIKGVNYVLALGDEKTYDIEQMEIKRLARKEFNKQYDKDEISDAKEVEHEMTSIMIDLLPKYEDNPLSDMVEPLYELLLDYNNIFYVLWPLVKRDDVENPYKPYVELWDRHLEPYIMNEHLIVIAG